MLPVDGRPCVAAVLWYHRRPISVRYLTIVSGGGTTALRNHHESRYPPELCSRHRHLQLWQRDRNSLHPGQAAEPGRVQRVPPVLHRQAENAGYRRPCRSLQAAFPHVRRQAVSLRTATQTHMGFTSLLKKASLVGAFFVFGVYAGGALAFCPAPANLPSAKVQRVVDGDTLRLVDGRTVRLIGLNSPEMGRQGRFAGPFAQAARQRLHALVAARGGRVGLQLGRQAKDHYGRTLAHAYDDRGNNLEAQLLAEGLGYQVAVAPNLALVQCQQAVEPWRLCLAPWAGAAYRTQWRRSVAGNGRFAGAAYRAPGVGQF